MIISCVCVCYGVTDQLGILGNTPRVNYSQLRHVELFPLTKFPNSVDNGASTSRPDPSAINGNGRDAQGTASSEAPVGADPGSTPSGAQSALPSLVAWVTENGLTGARIKTLEDNGAIQWISSRHCLKTTFRRWAWTLASVACCWRLFKQHRLATNPACHPAWAFRKHCCRQRRLSDPMACRFHSRRWWRLAPTTAAVPAFHWLTSKVKVKAVKMEVSTSTSAANRASVFEIPRCSCISLLKRVRFNTTISLTLFRDILPRKQRACSGRTVTLS